MEKREPRRGPLGAEFSRTISARRKKGRTGGATEDRRAACLEERCTPRRQRPRRFTKAGMSGSSKDMAGGGSGGTIVKGRGGNGKTVKGPRRMTQSTSGWKHQDLEGSLKREKLCGGVCTKGESRGGATPHGQSACIVDQNAT